MGIRAHSTHLLSEFLAEPKIVSVRLNRCGQTDSVVVYSGPNSYICGAFAHEIFSPENANNKVFEKTYDQRSFMASMPSSSSSSSPPQRISSIGGLTMKHQLSKKDTSTITIRFVTFFLFFLGVFCVWNFITSFGGCPLCMCLLLCSFEKLFTVRMRETYNSRTWGIHTWNDSILPASRLCASSTCQSTILFWGHNANMCECECECVCECVFTTKVCQLKTIKKLFCDRPTKW